MNNRIHLSLLGLALASASVSAQQRSSDFMADQATRAAMARPDVFLTPIHDEAGIDDRPGGTWATGPNYKVSFHAGMRFFPLLGSRYPHNLPLGWQTTSVAVGGTELLVPGEQAVSAPADWRMEYRYRNFTEAYDVLAEGVEQTFVIERRPQTAGDLVVRGRVETDLHVQSQGATHGAINFTDADGKTILEYGAAFAVDAMGAKAEMTTAVVDGEVVLTVPGAWLESATFPVTVDPLVTSVPLDTTNSQIVANGCVVHEPGADEYIVVLTRFFSASDTDIYGINYLPNWTLPVTVFLSSLEFSIERKPEIAYVAEAGRWVTVFERQSFGSNPEHRIAYHSRGAGLLTLDTTIFDLPQAPGTSRRNPDVGGTRPNSLGTRAAIVCEEENNSTNNNTTTTKIRLTMLDLATDTVVASSTVGSNQTDLEYPTINQETTGGGAPWVFAYQGYSNLIPGDDWDIQFGKLFTDGLYSPSALILGAASNSQHSLAPQVAGTGDRYMVSYIVLGNTGTRTAATTGTELRALQFTWPAASAINVRHDFRMRLAGAPLANVDLAFDTNTQGHWASLSHLASPVFGARAMTVQRVVDGAVVETESEGGGPGELTTGHGVCFDSFGDNFPIFFSSGSGADTWGTWLEQPATVPPSEYGLGCGTATIATFGDALSGSNNFGCSLNPPGTIDFTPAVLLISTGSSLPIPLDVAGFTGCFANVDLAGGFLGSIPTATSPFGALVVLPISGSFAGDIYFQWAYAAPGLNPSGFAFTKGLKATIVP